jgi:hypothetical protein
MPGKRATPSLTAEAPARLVFDADRPNIARGYDFLLGGKDNYAADRAEAERLMEVFPLLPLRARQNRLFLARAVTWLAGQGIRQFIDIGCGLPTATNTHQIAQAAHPDCRVAYVDRDPVVISHARALLSGPGVIALPGDLADPNAILADPALVRLITLAEPVAVIVAMVLHFFNAATAQSIAATLVRALAAGSYVVISVGSGDEQTGGRLAREYQAGRLYNHSTTQIEAFLDDLELIPPGLTDAMTWTPGQPAPSRSRLHGGHILAAVGRKPAD